MITLPLLYRRCKLSRFRGYYVRKYSHDYYKRKESLRNIENKNKEIVDQMNQHQVESTIYLTEYNERVMRERAERLASKLHHLKSTKMIPGVFNKPGMTKKIMHKNADQFLQETFKVSL